MSAPDKPDLAARRKLRAAGRASARSVQSDMPPALYLTDPDRTSDPLETIARLPRGWGVVLRHFGDPRWRSMARDIALLSRRRGLRLFIAADPELARRSGAHGVHWPEAMLSKVSPSRPHRKWTTSAHSRAALARARNRGACGVLVSTVFPSNSPSAGQAMGALKYRLLARKTGAPTYALGGVTAANVGQVSQWGGFAAIDGLTEAFGDPRT